MGCIEMKETIKVFIFQYEFNNNMGCIEIILIFQKSLICNTFNNNMGCIEINNILKFPNLAEV